MLPKFEGDKTIEVEKIKEFVNFLLAKEGLPTEEKFAYCFLLERVLFDTENYKGFRDLNGETNKYERRYY